MQRLIERERVALANLKYAEDLLKKAKEGSSHGDNGSDVQYCYDEVSRCGKLYDEAQNQRCEVERVVDEFTSYSDSYSRNQQTLVSDYTEVVKKSSVFLNKYSEYLQQSRQALDGGGDSATNNSGIVANNIQGRSLSQTQQTWHTGSDGSKTFNTPVETGYQLNANQGSCSANVNGSTLSFRGTCGIVSCSNVLTLAGVNANEQGALNRAVQLGICNIGIKPSSNGGTSADDRIQLLSSFGIPSHLELASTDNIAKAVSEGKGVIISVDAGYFWKNPQYIGGGHAITVTSVKLDANNNIAGFYICDSGTGGRDASKFYSAQHIQYALTGRQMNVTNNIIR